MAKSISNKFWNDIATSTLRSVSASGGSISNVLLEVTVPVLSDTDCRNSNLGNAFLTSNLCAGDLTNGLIDSCQVQQIIMILIIINYSKISQLTLIFLHKVKTIKVPIKDFIL